MEYFLSFWSQHNTAIIEGLLAIIILFTMFLAFQMFFDGKKNQKHNVSQDGDGSVILTTGVSAELEAKLDQLLENQKAQAETAASVQAQAGVQSVEDDSLDITEADESDTTTVTKKVARVEAAAQKKVQESEAEVAQFKISLSESQQRVLDLQAEIELLKKVAAEYVPVAEAADPELEARVLDLEARLSEYEIISDDLADLSRFKDENEALKKQLEELKAGSLEDFDKAALEAELLAVTAELEADPTEGVLDPDAIANINADDTHEQIEDQIAAAFAEAEAESKNETELINDELMSEFASTYQGKKDASGEKDLEASAAEEISPEDASVVPSADDAKLMEVFQGFKKKS